MGLSYDIISEFAKITNGNKEKPKEGIVYATIVQASDGKYVKIDGSDLLTPTDTTTDIEDGERVTVMIKDHKATVTGNVSAPSASGNRVDKVVEVVSDQLGVFETVVADKVSTNELEAYKATIEHLIAGKAEIEDLEATNAEIENLKVKNAEIENAVIDKATIEDLEAVNAVIENLKAKDAEIENLVADKATINDLNAVNADIQNLKAQHAHIEDLVADKADIEDLEATNAEIENLKVKDAEIENLVANKATIEDLEATKAEIEVLDADFAEIKTLVSGNLTSDNILSFNITADKVTMEDAFIKDAMIDTVNAAKINAGRINTNSVVIGSEDGGMRISGATQQFTDKNGNVRIQIGRDASNDFTFALYGEDGQGQIINQNGITASAIADGLIVNDMVSDNAAISGGKLDISSVVTEINNDNTTTIKSNKIYLDEQNQSLEVAFKSLKTQVDTIKDIDSDLTTITDKIQSNTSKIEANKSSISTLLAEDAAIKKQVTDLEGNVVETTNTLTSKYTSLQQNLDGFKTTVNNTYATKTSVNDVKNNLSSNYSTTSAMNSAINQKVDEITASVSSTYATKNEVKTIDDNIKANYSTTEQMTSAISVAKDEINLGISKVYETKTEVSNKIGDAISKVQIGGRNLVPQSRLLTTGNKGAWSIADTGNEGFKKLQIVTTDTGWLECQIPVTVEINSLTKKVTISFEYYESNAGLLAFSLGAFDDGSTRLKEITNVVVSTDFKVLATSPWKHVSYTFDPTFVNDVANATRYQIQFKKQAGKTGTIYVRKPKLEIGTVATDWSPAPEDITTDINTAKNDAITSANNTLNTTIANYYTKTQTDSQINVAKDAINLGVSQTYETKTNVTSKVNSAISTASSDATTKANNALSSAKTYADTKKSEAITSANNTLNSTIANYYTKSQTDSQIKVAKDAIDLSVKSLETEITKVEELVDSTQIGGRNLVSQSKLISNVNKGAWSVSATGNEGFNKLEIVTTSTEWLECQIPVYPHINTLTSKLTISFEYYESNAGILAFSFGAFNGLTRLKEITNVVVSTGFKLLASEPWKRVSYTFDPTSVNEIASATRYLIQFKKQTGKTGTVYVRKPKLEIGTVATDWSPAPEDVTTDITQAKNDAITSANNTLNTTIANYYTKTQTDSQIKVAKDAIDLSVKNTYETKTEVTNKLNDIQVGGTNLAYDTNKGATGWGWGIQTNNGRTITSETINGVNCVKFVKDATSGSGWNYVSYGRFKRDKITPSTTYVVSFEMKSNLSFNVASVNLMNGDSSYTLLKTITAAQNKVVANSTAWNKIIFKLTTLDTLPTSTAQVVYITGIPYSADATHYIRNLKLEVGNKATQWSPAPEDIIADIDTAKSDAITSANNTLNTTIANYYTKTQTDSQIKVAKDAITSSVSSTYETKTNVSALKNQISQINQNIRCNDLGAKINHSAFSTANAGEIYLHGYDSNNNPTDTNGKIYWNGVTLTVVKGMINPDSNFPFNTDVYIFVNKNSSGSYVYGMYYNTSTKAWAYKQLIGGTDANTNYTPNQDHIALGVFNMTSAEAFNHAYLFETPQSLVTLTNTNLNLVSRMSSAEQKITSDAIVSTVTSSKTYTDAMTGKVNKTEIISSINQTAESVKINASKIELTGSVVVNAINGGSTLINGSKIQTGTISANSITSGTFQGTNFIAGGSSNGNGYFQVKDSSNNVKFHASKDGVYATKIQFPDSISISGSIIQSGNVSASSSGFATSGSESGSLYRMEYNSNLGPLGLKISSQYYNTEGGGNVAGTKKTIDITGDTIGFTTGSTYTQLSQSGTNIYSQGGYDSYNGYYCNGTLSLKKASHGGIDVGNTSTGVAICSKTSPTWWNGSTSYDIFNSGNCTITSGSGGTSYRFANGLQINTMQIWGTWNITTAWGSVYSSPYISPSNYTQAFLNPPQVSITAHGAGTAIMVCQAGAPTTTSPGSYYLWKPVQQTGVKDYIEIISIGRWK